MVFFRIISNWRWHQTKKEYVPILLQFDGGNGPNHKFLKMQAMGARFVDPMSLCNHCIAVCNIRNSASPGNAVPLWLALHDYL